MNPESTSLDRLHDLVLPATNSWWPVAPGWYWLGGVVFFTLLAFLLKFFKRWQQDRYRREALAELAGYDWPLQLAELLKRTALSAFPRDQVASLTGPLWYSFLDRSAGINSFSIEQGKRLESSVYDVRLASGLDAKEFSELKKWVGEWIRKHDPEFERKKC